MTEGLLSEKTDDYCEPISYPLPKVSFRNINYLWRNKVLSLLKNFKKITHKEFLEYRKMYPKGFYVDVRYKATYDNPQERKKKVKIFYKDPLVCQNCGTEMQIKKVYTNYDAEKLKVPARVESKNLIHLRYYIRGRWRIERRKKYLGPISGKERRKAS